MVAIGYAPKLAQPVPAEKEIYLTVGETKPECPGFGEAGPGFLCAYAAWENGTSFSAWLSGFSNSVGATSGEVGTLFSLNSGSTAGNARGNWAYTAP